MNDVFVDPHPLGAFACGIFQRCWFEGGGDFLQRETEPDRENERERETHTQTDFRSVRHPKAASADGERGAGACTGLAGLVSLLPYALFWGKNSIHWHNDHIIYYNICLH